MAKEMARAKRITHLEEIQKKTESHLNEIVSMAHENIESCKGVIVEDIKKQQTKIKERIASRERSKERADVRVGNSIEKHLGGKKAGNNSNIEN